MILKDYGKARLDFSHEFLNLFTGLVEHPRLRVRAFHPDLEAMRHGPDGMRQRFRELVDRDPPQLLVHHPFTPELDIDLEALGELTTRGTLTVSWDADSSWRFEDWIKPRLPHYALSVTTHADSIPRYEAEGAKVHLSQWAISSWYSGFQPGGPRPLTASFIGRAHGDRKQIIRRLRRSGVRVDCWGAGFGPRRGFGWRLLGRGANHGYASWAEVRQAFGTSLVSLNLANASDPVQGNQIKGRHFEIPAFGACQLTTDADAIEQYYDPGEEIVVVQGLDELVETTRALARDRERAQRIGAAGFRRTWAEHTWRHRIDGILEALSLA